MRKPVAILGVTMLVAAGVNLFGAFDTGETVYAALGLIFGACALGTFTMARRQS